MWGSGDGPQFLPGSSCGLGLEEPQVRAVRVMEAAPPCKGVGAAGGAGAALPRVAVEGPVRAMGGLTGCGQELLQREAGEAGER